MHTNVVIGVIKISQVSDMKKTESTKQLNELGFSLVELLIAMVILAVIILSFTALFSSSFSGIFTAGRKSKALFEAQDELEQKIIGGTSLSTLLTVTFSDSSTITIPGELITGDVLYEGNTGAVTTFIPQR